MGVPVATTQAEKATDLATAVVGTMRQLGVPGLPRNYEIFYEALSGSNPELSLEVVSLPKRPSQEELDRIGQKYFPQHHGNGIVETARETVARELEEIAAVLRNGTSHLEKYGQILDQTASGLGKRDIITRELLDKITSVMAAATNSTIDQNRHVTSALNDKSAELESVKSKLEEYKRLANTDPLTQLWNRRAFDRELGRIYGSNKDILFNALILIDIDRFKDINDRFGHPIGDRIIQIIADVFRACVRRDMFVARTGGEEFAMIVEGVGEDVTYEIAERIRLHVEQTAFGTGAGNVRYGPVTVSMGICMASDGQSPADLYAKADRALYRSKVNGRNRSTLFSSLQERSGKSWLLYRKD